MKVKRYDVIIAVGPPITKLTDDMVKDLEEAIEHAHYNLYTRYKIKVSLSSFKRHDEYTACFQIEDTKEILTEKNVGTHLKGISKYLLMKYPEKYRPLQEGTRLLYYDMSPCSVSYF